MIHRSEPCRGRFPIFEKKAQFFPLQGKNLTPSHFVQKLAQIVIYGQPSVESRRVNPGDGFQYLSSYQNVSRWKNRNWWKKISIFFFLTNFLKGYFKGFPEKPFFSKKHFFVFCRKFGFNLKKLSNHYSQLKKQVKVDPETRSHDFLTKTRQKIRCRGIS